MRTGDWTSDRSIATDGVHATIKRGHDEEIIAYERFEDSRIRRICSPKERSSLRFESVHNAINTRSINYALGIDNGADRSIVLISPHQVSVCRIERVNG